MVASPRRCYRTLLGLTHAAGRPDRYDPPVMFAEHVGENAAEAAVPMPSVANPVPPLRCSLRGTVGVGGCVTTADDQCRRADGTGSNEAISVSRSHAPGTYRSGQRAGVEQQHRAPVEPLNLRTGSGTSEGSAADSASRLRRSDDTTTCTRFAVTWPPAEPVTIPATPRRLPPTGTRDPHADTPGHMHRGGRPD
jgi:hypothetical protein